MCPTKDLWRQPRDARLDNDKSFLLCSFIFALKKIRVPDQKDGKDKPVLSNAGIREPSPSFNQKKLSNANKALKFIRSGFSRLPDYIKALNYECSVVVLQYPTVL